MSAVLSPGLSVRPALRLEVWLARGGLAAAALALFLTLAAPLLTILVKSVQDKDGNWIGLAGFVQYFATPSLLSSITHSLTFAALTTLITIPLAFGLAYAIQRSCMPLRGVFRGIALIPILAPSLLSALSLIYLFGNQGVLKSWVQFFGLSSIYGLPGMTLAMVFSAFPHALMILLSGLALSDARLYEAADSMGTSALRKFRTITLPGAKYGIISASMVVFTMAVAEFGVVKIIGGNYNVLATDIYIQVIGQQNFAQGAVISLLLLIPAVFAFLVDWMVQRRQRATLSARFVLYVPKPDRIFDGAMFVFSTLIAVAMLAMMGMAIFASFVKLWPYNLSMSLRHYIFGLGETGMDVAYINSLKMACFSALAGTLFIFATAYGIEKLKQAEPLKMLIRFLAIVPMAVPGLVLGLGYIFFFNHPLNPANGLYETLTLMVICTIVHFYSSAHLTAVTALKALDSEFESVSASLKVPFYKTFARVTLPICLPAVIDIARYLFVNAMTTISALVFIYAPKTVVASIAVVQMSETGEVGAAAAMATLIVATSAVACLGFWLLQWLLGRSSQRWRRPAG
jgi:iron(III) transport system permease protein